MIIPPICLQAHVECADVLVAHFVLTLYEGFFKVPLGIEDDARSTSCDTHGVTRGIPQSSQGWRRAAPSIHLGCLLNKDRDKGDPRGLGDLRERTTGR